MHQYSDKTRPTNLQYLAHHGNIITDQHPWCTQNSQQGAKLKQGKVKSLRYLIQKATPSRPIPEQVIKIFLLEMAVALKHMHSNQWIHGKLSPDNVVFTSSDPHYNHENFTAPTGEPVTVVKVKDLGLGKRFNEAIIDLGILWYAAPELLSRLISPLRRTDIIGTALPALDVWSFGCIAFELVSGIKPFEGESFQQQLEMIKEVEEYGIDGLVEEFCKGLRDKNLKSLIIGCLQVDRTKRLTIDQILRSEYLAKEFSKRNPAPLYKDFDQEMSQDEGLVTESLSGTGHHSDDMETKFDEYLDYVNQKSDPEEVPLGWINADYTTFEERREAYYRVHGKILG
ncbi:hypothetical protein WICPIJ_009274 [Wickerhamomyces pijperi]|uniref:Protein kinase domain-containing protein n=1 Tax=Wickerhamomyces pijperi TaxID=599730 RepID=A0A9P8PPG3_WICPI|nr:hypothetical protein WICPIJ_009274 [Wickerhamomyces pijperi]